MNAVANVIKHERGALKKFLATLGLCAPLGRAAILENPSEELAHELARGRHPKVYKMAATGPVNGRIEENYLYYTRRFPLDTADNTIGSGAIVAQDYLYFTNGIGDQGSAAGYFSVANLGLQQTNMASGGKIPSGQAFELFDLGISFNAAAAPADIAAMMDVSVLRFEKQNQSLVVQHGPISLWPGGTGLYGFAATTATTTTINGASNGMPALSNVRRTKWPRQISANEQFQYVINCVAKTPNKNGTVALTDFVEMRIWLFGHQINAIAG